MASAFQNRLIGTIILVALAVIFLPSILDGEKVSRKDDYVDIPPRPKMEPIEVAKPFPMEEVKQTVNRKVEILNETPVDEPVAIETVNTAEDPKDSAETAEQNIDEGQSVDFKIADEAPVQKVSAGWVVQLGSFRHRKNVRDLLNKLEAAGYRAFSRQVQTSAGELTKVFVGPDLQKETLEKSIPHLNELTSLKGRLAEFTLD